MGKRAALFYIPSLTDTKLIDEEIIKPLIMTDKVIQDVPSAISVSAIEEKAVSKAVKELNAGKPYYWLRVKPKLISFKQQWQQAEA